MDRSRIDLEVLEGEELADARGLLESSGKSVRDVKVKSLGEIGVGPSKALIREAHRLNKIWLCCALA